MSSSKSCLWPKFSVVNHLWHLRFSPTRRLYYDRDDWEPTFKHSFEPRISQFLAVFLRVILRSLINTGPGQYWDHETFTMITRRPQTYKNKKENRIYWLLLNIQDFYSKKNIFVIKVTWHFSKLHTFAATSALISSCVSARRFLANSVLRSQSAINDSRWSTACTTQIQHQNLKTLCCKCIESTSRWAQLNTKSLTSSSKNKSLSLDAIS